MKLLLARHGNTFSPEMTPVFVGAQNDLPLVSEGYRQAERFAKWVQSHFQAENKNVKLAAVYCGPLKRTRQFAQQVIQSLKLDLSTIIDERLNELDYGAWSGKTNEQVMSQFGEEALKGWNDHSSWPDGCNWGSSPTEIAREVGSFVDDLVRNHKHDETILAVSSNGRLRYFLQLISGCFEEKALDKSLKVSPGNACEIEIEASGIRLISWNQSP
jgi:probable phosphoglycerate mutase